MWLQLICFIIWWKEELCPPLTFESQRKVISSNKINGPCKLANLIEKHGKHVRCEHMSLFLRAKLVWRPRGPGGPIDYWRTTSKNIYV